LERDKSSVRKYVHFDELKDCLESGWSVPVVHKHLIERYGEAPSERAIQRWRAKHAITARVIPYKFITEKLKGVRYQVDLLEMVSRLVYLSEDRLGRGLEYEVNERSNVPIATTDGVIHSYLAALREWRTVAQDLGIIPQKAPAIIDRRKQTHMANPDALRALLELAKEFEELGFPDDSEG